MDSFKPLTGTAAPLPQNDIDTDVIYPAVFLKTVKRTGLADCLFHEARFNEDGSEKPDFILNQGPYRNAEILIAGKNYGCGSSREHAAWAMLDYGIRCVIAPSFGDIFYNNSFKNGLLPIALPQEQIDELVKEAQENPDAPITIDLEKQTVTRGNKFSFEFEIDPFRKHCLLNGLDDIALTMEKEKDISSYEDKRSEDRSWL